jgi:hypothetical protein
MYQSPPSPTATPTSGRLPIDPPVASAGAPPHYAAGPVAPEEPAPALTPREALLVRLETLQQELRTDLKAARDTGALAVVGHTEIIALNADLEHVRRLNTDLPHPRRLSAADAWPSPVLPTNALLGPRNLLPLLGAALHIVRASLSASTRHV